MKDEGTIFAEKCCKKNRSFLPKNQLKSRIRINYRNTFEVLDPDRPQEFLEAIRRYAPQQKIEEK